MYKPFLCSPCWFEKVFIFCIGLKRGSFLFFEGFKKPIYPLLLALCEAV